MNFAHPMALCWGLAAAAVIVLYLRRVRGPRQPASAAMFWDQVLADAWLRRRWQRWRNVVSALVQLLILALVVVALAEPRRSRPEQIVLVVDCAASSPLAAAKEAAARWIAASNDYDQMAILSAARAPTVSAGWTSDRAKLREALGAITAVDAASDVPATLALARWMTADRPGARVVVLGEGNSKTTSPRVGQSPSPPAPLPERERGEIPAGRHGRPLWWFFAGAALVLCALEWCLYQRRWIS